jgi:hypothetical protein
VGPVSPPVKAALSHLVRTWNTARSLKPYSLGASSNWGDSLPRASGGGDGLDACPKARILADSFFA